eukprot:TRINITY_DN10828_c1_g3_i1.p1 TRINITY_DN10828_c1_g3~~TRINITY_DN10828_c1_g3_i1.p1  ORF type:complete len:1099 (-),score=293.28 TRINITY_DN10828_c1_g3_i1:52-3195(-)
MAAAPAESAADDARRATVACRVLLARLCLERRLRRACCGLALLLAAACLLASALDELYPAEALREAERAVRQQLGLDSTVKAVTDRDGAYTAIAALAAAVQRLDPRVVDRWCDEGNFTTRWDDSLALPVSGCTLPLRTAIQVNADAQPGAVSVRRPRRGPQALGPAVVVQRRVEDGELAPACEGFAGRLNELAQLHVASKKAIHLAGGLAEGTSSLGTCGGSGGSGGGGNSSEDELLAMASRERLLRAAQLLGSGASGDDATRSAERLRQLEWLDERTESVHVSALIYTAGVNVYSRVSLELRPDSFGQLEASPGATNVVSFRPLPDDAAFLTRLIAAMVFSCGGLLLSLRGLLYGKSAYRADAAALRADPQKGLESGDDAGVPVRRSRSLEDESDLVENIRWGAIVVGSRSGPGWLRVANGYVRTAVSGVPVLVRLEGCAASLVLGASSRRALALEALAFLLATALAIAALSSWASQPHLDVAFAGALRAVAAEASEAARDLAAMDAAVASAAKSVVVATAAPAAAAVDAAIEGQAEAAAKLLAAGIDFDMLQNWRLGLCVAGYLVLLVATMQVMLYVSCHPKPRFVARAVRRCVSDVFSSALLIVVLFAVAAFVAQLAFGGHFTAYASFHAACVQQLRWLFAAAPRFGGGGATRALPTVVLVAHRIYSGLFLLCCAWLAMFFLVAVVIESVSTRSTWRSSSRSSDAPDSRTAVELLEAACSRGPLWDAWDAFRTLRDSQGAFRERLVAVLQLLPDEPGAVEIAELQRALALPGSPHAVAPSDADDGDAEAESPELSRLLQLYDWKCHGSLLHPAAPAAEDEGAGELEPGDKAPEEPVVRIAGLDSDAQADVLDSVRERIEAWLAWAEGSVEKSEEWEQLATAMACGLLQQLTDHVGEYLHRQQGFEGGYGGHHVPAASATLALPPLRIVAEEDDEVEAEVFDDADLSARFDAAATAERQRAGSPVADARGGYPDVDAGGSGAAVADSRMPGSPVARVATPVMPSSPPPRPMSPSAPAAAMAQSPPMAMPPIPHAYEISECSSESC